MAKQKSGLHEGHRKRLKESIDNDPELVTLSDYETLEYILSFFIPRKNTNEIAHRLIEKFGTFYGVLVASPEDLYPIKDMTKNAAHFLPNLLAIFRKAEISRTNRICRIETVRDSAKVLRPFFLSRNYESFYMMLLDINNKVITIDSMSKGTGMSTSVDIGEVVHRVMRFKASRVLLAHNHPGGNLVPSNEDVKLTSILTQIFSFMGIIIVDHLIFAGDKYYSFYESGDLDAMMPVVDKIHGTDRASEVRMRKSPQHYALEDPQPFCDTQSSGADVFGTQNDKTLDSYAELLQRITKDEIDLSQFGATSFIDSNARLGSFYSPNARSVDDALPTVEYSLKNSKKKKATQVEQAKVDVTGEISKASQCVKQAKAEQSTEVLKADNPAACSVKPVATFAPTTEASKADNPAACSVKSVAAFALGKDTVKTEKSNKSTGEIDYLNGDEPW